MFNSEYISEVIRLDYLQSLQQNSGKSIENLQKDEDFMITFSDLNVWFFNKDSHMFIDSVKNIFDSLEQNILGKAKLSDFMNGYTKMLMDSVQLLLNQQQKIQTFQRIIKNTQILEQLFQQNISSTSEGLTKCTETMIDSRNFKIKDINNKYKEQTESTFKQQNKTLNRFKIYLSLKDIVNIDLTPSFSKHDLEGYQLEIGDQKCMQSSSVRYLEGNSINWRDEQINITMRPKCQSIMIKLYEVLSQGKNLVAQITIDPFTLLCPYSFNTFQNINHKNSLVNQNLIHTIPLQCYQTGKQVYCNLILSAQIMNEENIFGLSQTYLNEQLGQVPTEQLLRILNKRADYMSETLRYGIEKYEKMIKYIKMFVKPFQSIKIDESYLKY